ncbi:sedoheptulose-1,7-bisphosphatase [Plectosphaerella plurivora]|uniref:Sedoheptulose-1,7-bisphosphatase n=1 Tax=Plectosphaerella plurivora TaxID=936078 RepID=A0A9P8V5K9_9PEZI|nr:sedoheptulose-1,7-bisphosphatase [Plectosphaerella plurivora]
MGDSQPGVLPLAEHLAALLPTTDRTSLAQSVIPSLIQSIADIADTLRVSHHVALAGTANAFGDDQLNVDVAAEAILRTALASCPSVVAASSEEDPVEVAVPHETAATSPERYAVAFDPLDGSSIIAPNWTVGTIIGIWDGPTALAQDPATAQIASILGVFGPRTTAVVAIRVPGGTPSCFEVAIDPSPARAHTVIRPSVRLNSAPHKTRYFAPANLRAAADEPRYAALVSRFITERWTLRYSGGLVPDLIHALVKGHGVYASPVTARSAAKLRRLYELCPVALIMECAGGSAVDSADGSRVLGRSVLDCDERGGLVCGNVEDVAEVVSALLGSSQ